MLALEHEVENSKLVGVRQVAAARGSRQRQEGIRASNARRAAAEEQLREAEGRLVASMRGACPRPAHHPILPAPRAEPAGPCDHRSAVTPCSGRRRAGLDEHYSRAQRFEGESQFAHRSEQSASTRVAETGASLEACESAIRAAFGSIDVERQRQVRTVPRLEVSKVCARARVCAR